MRTEEPGALASRPYPSLRAWIGAGLALDALVIGVMWFALEARRHGPVPPDEGTGLGSWDIVAIALVPWLVHTLALQALFDLPQPRFADVKTLGYIVCAIMAVQIGFFALVVLDAPVFFIFYHIVPAAEAARSPALTAAVALAVTLAVSSSLGAALGAMVALFRRAPGARAPLRRARADVIGVALAGAIGMAALTGLTWPRFPYTLFHDEPRQPALILLAYAAWLSAFIPHLVLTHPSSGRAFVNPRPATSISDAAPSAPSR